MCFIFGCKFLLGWLYCKNNFPLIQVKAVLQTTVKKIDLLNNSNGQNIERLSGAFVLAVNCL